MALMIALMMVCFVFTLAISLMTFAEEDGRFAFMAECSTQAYYMARTGLSYYQYQPQLFTPGTPVTGTPVAATPNQIWVAELYANTDVQAVGIVNTLDNSPSPIAQRTLYVPHGAFPMIRDVSR
jgi:hypothetical protein